MELTLVSTNESPELARLWEASVRATHHFLKPADLQFYKERIPAYFSTVRLTAVRDGLGKIVAFMGTHGQNIEMLFVDPVFRGHGIGKQLVRYAVDGLDCNCVDVNEQNGQAVGFYERMGFRVDSRSACDAEGMPYPILHMKLARGGCGAGE